MLKLRLQCFGPPNVKSPVIAKDPDDGKDGSQKGKRVAEGDVYTALPT